MFVDFKSFKSELYFLWFPRPILPASFALSQSLSLEPSENKVYHNRHKVIVFYFDTFEQKTVNSLL